jgi:uncharacterized membrane protein
VTPTSTPEAEEEDATPTVTATSTPEGVAAEGLLEETVEPEEPAPGDEVDEVDEEPTVAPTGEGREGEGRGTGFGGGTWLVVGGALLLAIGAYLIVRGR